VENKDRTGHIFTFNIVVLLAILHILPFSFSQKSLIVLAFSLMYWILGYGLLLSTLYFIKLFICFDNLFNLPIAFASSLGEA